MINKAEKGKIKLNKTRVKILSKSIGTGTGRPINEFLAKWSIFEKGIGTINRISGNPWNETDPHNAIYVNDFAFAPQDLELIPDEEKKN